MRLNFKSDVIHLLMKENIVQIIEMLFEMFLLLHLVHNVTERGLSCMIMMAKMLLKKVILFNLLLHGVFQFFFI